MVTIKNRRRQRLRIVFLAMLLRMKVMRVKAIVREANPTNICNESITFRTLYRTSKRGSLVLRHFIMPFFYGSFFDPISLGIPFAKRVGNFLYKGQTSRSAYRHSGNENWNTGSFRGGRIGIGYLSLFCGFRCFASNR